EQRLAKALGGSRQHRNRAPQPWGESSPVAVLPDGSRPVVFSAPGAALRNMAARVEEVESISDQSPSQASAGRCALRATSQLARLAGGSSRADDLCGWPLMAGPVSPARRARAARVRRQGGTQRQAADAARVDVSTVQRWERTP